MKINITKKSLCTAVLLLLSALAAQAQVTLSGTVTDSQSKETLAGVSIAVKGTVTGTITDTKGKFSLTVNRPAPFTLVITSVGYKTQEMEITGGRSDIDVTLEEQAIMGQEVVV
ncbi:MAG: carboxypeptidase-like regulatory domain-containing protein, partial [Cytophagales bacterium]|nr:carboxypeptidase-like regulatory domain-containing protein [Cytophagales bacterium]